ncbi:hypothetical protein J6524_02310 [Bradyrhizobium sp. WSM 1738]|uniref:hypothetical protein n=1 Tax=Bradyrhizobium hereditatis TaxID=2821405 RepID=UPI001CE37C07|nr:hypothetical protein [Bradyrhizobium hereditatis]MCA6113766.1 hypothetical protein [Bradyrhizobium hereditatis]
MSWDRPFAQPVPLPKGPPAQTLRDAANYIRTLPQSERDRQEWRLAIQMLIDAAEDRGPMLFARMGIIRALEAHIESTLDAERASQGKLKDSRQEKSKPKGDCDASISPQIAVTKDETRNGASSPASQASFARSRSAASPGLQKTNR